MPHPAFGPVASEATVATEQLPGVDVGRHDEQVGELLGVVGRGDVRREDLLHPRPVHRLAVLGDAGHQLLVGLLGEHQQRLVSAPLVVVDDDVDRRGDVPDRGTSLVGHGLLRVLERRLIQAGPAPEVSQDGLDADPGASGDVVERDVGHRALAVEGDARVDDPGAGLLDGAGPGGHRVGAGRVHVSASAHQYPYSCQCLFTRIS